MTGTAPGSHPGSHPAIAPGSHPGIAALSHSFRRRLGAFSTAALLLAGVAGLATLGGCATSKEVDQMRTLYRQAQDRIVELESRLEDKDAQIAMLQGGSPRLERELSRLRQERDELAKLLEEARAQLEAGPTVIETPVAVPLAAEVDSALRELAASNPGLMSYDADRGMVRLQSDLTFALGSAEVRDGAATALRRLAAVLKSAAAQPYDVRIVGHTDNVPVNSAAGRQRFGDNWGLSAYRAIAVKSVLQDSGVQPVRLEVAGRGQYYPVVPNGPKGAEANRRVEIYLVEAAQRPTIDASSPAGGSPSGASSSAGASSAPSAPSGRQSDPAMFK